MEKEFTWSILVPIDLFLGGLSGGTFIVSILADLSRKEAYQSIAKFGAWIAPFPLLVGILSLIFDLGRPLRFWHLLIYFNPTSVMSLGVIFLNIFGVLSTAYAFLWWADTTKMAQDLSKRLFFPVGDLLSWIIKEGRVLRWPIGLVGLFSGAAVGLYTGALISACSFNPVWSSPLMPLLFHTSAVSTGIALLILVTYFLRAKDREKRHALGVLGLLDALLILIGLECFILGSLFLGWHTTGHVGAKAIEVFFTGGYYLWVWIGVVLVGLLIPFFLGLYGFLSVYYKKKETHEAIPAIIASLGVLIGGFILRYVIIFSGQSV
ncbi:MAG: NrfD/PsrC family molybdoenzyme membrane anchor subunit [bacterium]